MKTLSSLPEEGRMGVEYHPVGDGSNSGRLIQPSEQLSTVQKCYGVRLHG